MGQDPEGTTADPVSHSFLLFLRKMKQIVLIKMLPFNHSIYCAMIKCMLSHLGAVRILHKLYSYIICVSTILTYPNHYFLHQQIMRYRVRFNLFFFLDFFPGQAGPPGPPGPPGDTGEGGEGGSGRGKHVHILFLVHSDVDVECTCIPHVSCDSISLVWFFTQDAARTSAM